MHRKSKHLLLEQNNCSLLLQTIKIIYNDASCWQSFICFVMMVMVVCVVDVNHFTFSISNHLLLLLLLLLCPKAMSDRPELHRNETVFLLTAIT